MLNVEAESPSKKTALLFNMNKLAILDLMLSPLRTLNKPSLPAQPSLSRHSSPLSSQRGRRRLLVLHDLPDIIG